MRVKEWLMLALVLGGVALLSVGRSAPDGAAMVLEVDGPIGPPTRDYLVRGLDQAAAEGAQLVILEMDTPGGLLDSTRDIISAILASEVPVATYVSPEGARAASAGTFILYASHIAAMAPATNLGAATPVGVGGRVQLEDLLDELDNDNEATERDEDERDNDERDDGEREDDGMSAGERKAINDAVAYIRGLAERRGRNADWAEEAVRDAATLSSSEALEKGVIEFRARNITDLLSQLDGHTVEVAGTEITLSTDGIEVIRVEPDWRTQFLQIITNPTVAYLLMLIGIYGLIFEGYNPGAIVPGVIGAISLLLALFAFQILPVNFAGLALIVLGIVLIVAETLVPSFGALGLGGVAAFVAGSVILIDSDVPGFGVSLPLIIGIATTGALLTLAIAMMAVKVRYRPVVSGNEQLLSAHGEAMTDFVDGRGQVWLLSERWQAVAAEPIAKGDPVRVTAVNGLELTVEKQA